LCDPRLEPNCTPEGTAVDRQADSKPASPATQGTASDVEPIRRRALAARPPRSADKRASVDVDLLHRARLRDGRDRNDGPRSLVDHGLGHFGYEERDDARRRRSRDTTRERILRLSGGSSSERSVRRRRAAATSSCAEEPGSTLLSTSSGGSAESSEDSCSSRSSASSGLERGPRTSVAKRGSTSTSSGLTVSGSAGLWPVAAIRDLYPSNKGRSHDERLVGSRSGSASAGLNASRVAIG
jgi:hypothetical protein